MPFVRKHLAHIVNGELNFVNTKSFGLDLLALEDKDVFVTVAKVSEQRSGQQNKYYFGVIVATLAEFFGYLPDEMHAALKMLFLRKENEGWRPATVRSTSDLTTKEAEEYYATIRRWAAQEYGISIPEPHEIEVIDENG